MAVLNSFISLRKTQFFRTFTHILAMKNEAHFAETLINWYQKHKRPLPWRETRDPYIIWLSEIILQQTRVEQGLPYFLRFVERFPNLEDFAQAKEDEILRLWQGLGYYSRARNMHKAAQQVMLGFEGKFPIRHAELLQLKGVGAYTAAAIASFAGGEAKAVVDGNVFRLLARYFGIYTAINSNKGKKQFQEIADALIDEHRPGLFNQAIMEFGSQQCRPKNPICSACVLQNTCFAFLNDKVQELPVKEKKGKVKERYFNYFLVRNEAGDLLMQKRGKGDIWENLFEFPLIEWSNLITPLEENTETQEIIASVKSLFGEKAHIEFIKGPVKHVLSHQIIYANFWNVTGVSKENEKKVNWNYVNLKQINILPKPKLIFSMVEELIN